MTKTKNIFDHLMSDPENIDEKTIYEKTGVDKENVKNLLMNKIHADSTPTVVAPKKKNKRKTITLSLIAAAAAVAVLGTTAAATGSFHSVFGQWFAGEMQGNMYAGGNVNFESETLSTDFKGIAGDKHDAYGIMSVTKQDGSAFVENTDDYFVAYVSDAEIDCTISAWDQIANKLWYYGQELRGGDISYEFTDTNTINAIIHYGSNGFNIIGETLSVKENQIYIAHVDKVLCTYDEWVEYAKKHTDPNEEYEPLIEKAAQPYLNTLREDQEFIFKPNGDFVIATVSPSDLSYNLSVQLNYKDTSKKFPSANGIKTTYHDTPMTVKSLEVNALSLRLDLLYPTEDMDEINQVQNKWDDSVVNSVTVTMKDGTVYTSAEKGFYQSDNMQRIEVSFSSDDYKLVVINPDDIASIVYNGVTLYNS